MLKKYNIAAKKSKPAWGKILGHSLCQTTDPPPPHVSLALHCCPGREGQVALRTLPSRSALSDLGLIADFFEKNLLNWSSFCLKSLFFWPKNSGKSNFYSFSLPYKAKKT